MENKIINVLKRYTKHNNIYLTERGNKSILIALKIIKNKFPEGKILIPDQGSWITYFQFAKKLKLDIIKLKTDYGVIDLNTFKNSLKDACAIIYSNPAAYFAEQPIKEIYEICKENNIFIILDISGSIGSDYYEGNYADILLGSFGKGKPVNLGYGGFISFNDTDLIIKNNKILNELNFDQKYHSPLLKKLENLKKRYQFLDNINKKIKNELKDYNILHQDKGGINVIVKFNNEEEKNNIIEYCEKNKYEFVECPKLIKVNEDAISIEVKRLE